MQGCPREELHLEALRLESGPTRAHPRSPSFHSQGCQLSALHTVLAVNGVARSALATDAVGFAP